MNHHLPHGAHQPRTTQMSPSLVRRVSLRLQIHVACNRDFKSLIMMEMWKLHKMLMDECMCLASVLHLVASQTLVCATLVFRNVLIRLRNLKHTARTHYGDQAQQSWALYLLSLSDAQRLPQGLTVAKTVIFVSGNTLGLRSVWCVFKCHTCGFLFVWEAGALKWFKAGLQYRNRAQGSEHLQWLKPKLHRV